MSTKPEKNWKQIAYRLARKLDQVMTIDHKYALTDSRTWCFNADRLITKAGVKPGSSKRYSPQQDKS